MDNRLISRIAREGGTKLLDLAVGRLLPGDPSPAVDEKPVKKKGSVAGTLAGAALVRIATRSVPGAIVVGGGLLAKALYERKKAREAAVAAAAQPPDLASQESVQPSDEQGR